MAGWAHGAIIALMLDEVMGQVAAEVFGRYNIVTAGLGVRFRTRLVTPKVALARAYMGEGGEDVRRGDGRGGDRRKLKIIGRVEDGEGGIFTERASEFVKLRPKL